MARPAGCGPGAGGPSSGRRLPFSVTGPPWRGITRPRVGKRGGPAGASHREQSVGCLPAGDHRFGRSVRWSGGWRRRTGGGRAGGARPRTGQLRRSGTGAGRPRIGSKRWSTALSDSPTSRRPVGIGSQQVMAPSDCLLLVLGCRQPRAVDAGKRGLGRPARGERVRRNGCSPRLHGWVATETGHESASRRHWFERAGGRRTVMRVVPVRLVAAWTVASRGPRPRPYLTRHPATACWPAQHPRRCSLAC
jgi:hypothetical protein